jgi:hypothetical protein
MEPRRVCGPVVADSHPDLYLSEKSDPENPEDQRDWNGANNISQRQ